MSRNKNSKDVKKKKKEKWNENKRKETGYRREIFLISLMIEGRWVVHLECVPRHCEKRERENERVEERRKEQSARSLEDRSAQAQVVQVRGYKESKLDLLVRILCFMCPLFGSYYCFYDSNRRVILNSIFIPFLHISSYLSHKRDLLYSKLVHGDLHRRDL